MTEAEKLAALSEAATPGTWQQSHRKRSDGMYSTEVYCADGGTIATFAWYPKPVDAAGWIGTYRSENAALIVALVNAYRANQLVLIGPDAVEVAARAMAELHLPGSKQLWKMYVPLARATLAALGVK